MKENKKVDKSEMFFRIPKIENTCEKCRFAIIDACRISCAKYRVKPQEIYYEGEDCPKFEPVSDLQK